MERLIDLKCAVCSHEDAYKNTGNTMIKCKHCGSINLELFSLESHQVDPPGIKHDSNKLPLHLLAPEALFGTASALKFGAEKYAERNWERGMAWSRVFASLMRHMWVWWRGEELDAESGLSHLHHAACCIMFLQTYAERGIGLDDRPK
jgi:hypothetical protein